jgi:hypothetical protein
LFSPLPGRDGDSLGECLFGPNDPVISGVTGCVHECVLAVLCAVRCVRACMCAC